MPNYTPASGSALYPSYAPSTLTDPVTYTYNENPVNNLRAIDYNQLLCEVLRHQALLQTATGQFTVRNDSGGTFTKGTQLYISGWSATSTCFVVSKADATDSTKYPVLTITADLATASTAIAYLNTAVTGLDTSTAVGVGSKVFLDPATPGAYVFDTVTAGSTKFEVGVVETINVATGIIYFYPGFHLLQAASSSNVSTDNKLINGGFQFYQRQIPTTDTTIADQGFGPDRWKSFIENASVQSKQVAGPTTGITSNAYGRYTKITNTGKIFIAQIVEATNCQPMRSQKVIFQVKMRASTSLTFNIGIIYSTGTADSPTAGIVSAYGANGTDPTLTGWTAITPQTIGTTGTINGLYARQSLTTAFSSTSVCATIPATANNVAVVIFPNNQMTAAQYLEVAEGGLFYGDTIKIWGYDQQSDLAECQRFYEKSFDIATNPAQNSGTELGAVDYYCKVAGLNTDGRQVTYKVAKRISAPTVTTISPGAASSAWWNYSGTPAASGAATVRASGQGSFVVENAQAAADATGNRIGIHWTSSAEI